MPQKNVSDEDVQKARSHVDDLRDKIKAERAKVATAEGDRNNAVLKARLDAEASVLEAELAAVKEQAKVSKGSVSNDPVFEQVEAQAVTETTKEK